MIDPLNPSELNDYHEFRRKNFNFLYVCPGCGHGFETVEPVEKCRHCGHAVKEIEKRVSPKAKLSGPLRFRYFCTKCQKSLVTNERIDRCQLCGHHIIHMYPWARMGIRDRILSIMTGIVRKSKKPKLPSNINIVKEKEEVNEKKEEVREEKEPDVQPIPKRSFSYRIHYNRRKQIRNSS